MSNLEKLTAGGFVLIADQVTPEDKKLIEALSEEEVDALLSITRKMGTDFGMNAPPDTYSDWKMSNAKKLTENGFVLKADQIPNEDLTIIESLDREEIDSLIGIVSKLGDSFGSNALRGTYWR